MANFINVSIFIIILLVAILAAILVLRIRLKGKIIAFIVERNKTVSHSVFKPEHNFFRTHNKGEKYHINTDSVVFMDYPLGVPSIFRVPMPCLFYPRDHTEPLNPDDMTLSILSEMSNAKKKGKKLLNATETEFATRKEVVKNIVVATGEEMKSRIPTWLIPAILVVLVLILGLLIWGINGKIDSLISMT